jgi:hypothetical protein
VIYHLENWLECRDSDSDMGIAYRRSELGLGCEELVIDAQLYSQGYRSTR